ncbi:LytTR family transcriptional regulator [Altererythrobacter sp. SALINAS58]|uniref:LytTR family DNA-binding domain-containing protein n=1 Tax=Alteripontixanthobacter muriae TaxID=2705546 RepID=UPI0015759704|nr:LytTR family DNA-binding domain-containing protein [Alteripontixanthobacter muriae]NTZ42682.1 LytTR family transcriptional regulator [Alteripontixanthobacter muriae]
MRRFLLALALLVSCVSAARAEPIAPARLVQCSPASAGAALLSSCHTTSVGDVDPQGRLIELQGWFEIPDDRIAREPLALYLSGKNASTVHLNGTAIGSNGLPGASADMERAGEMDTQFYLPPDLLRKGMNRITIRMSAQHGMFNLTQPVHAILIDRHRLLSDHLLRLYWPALITFGAFLIATLYFGVLAAGSRVLRGDAVLLALLSLFAAGQLLAEVSRGLWTYPYPVHDLRLLAILFCAFGFGSCLTAHLWRRFARWYWVRATLGTQGVIAFILMLVPGFDLKTVLATLLPTLAGVVVLVRWMAARQPGAAAYLAAFTAFAALCLLGPFAFLDIAFYYAVAALLGFLFVQQALALVATRRERAAAVADAARLEAALDQARERAAPSPVSVLDGSRITLMPADRIIRCQGAGDYVELFLEGGATLLHSGSLSGLEDSLPDTFLRVHRSHIVNSTCIVRLERDASGTGTLSLVDGSDVPVSRRIMPRIKSQLRA